ncbi:hypothetical protein SESBI_33227 [Sesbania bispinosa]|nr:hypothetical protein SESBI_33227 [Sesbania bispinosa]
MAMIPGGIHPIKALCSRREDWRLMVKLVRFWNMCSLATPNEPGKVRCAIFGDMVDVVCGLMSASDPGLPVVVIQLAKVNFYKGHVGIQNVMNASKIYWNPDWPIAVEFKNSLVVHEVETDFSIGTISDRGRPVCLREEFLKLYPKKSVSQLGSFVVLGTITEIVEETSWWYMACTCMKAVSYDPGFPYCDDCKTVLFELTPRYKLKLVVSDGIESAQLIMFDSECFTLLSKPCREMSKGLSPAEFPAEIKELVKRACVEPSIIDEFKEALDDETPLKLKFAPPFSKMGNIKANSCSLDLTTDMNVVASVLDVSPISIGQSSSTGGKTSSSPDDGGEGNKRELDNSIDASMERLKRPKRKVVKTEKQ